MVSNRVVRGTATVQMDRESGPGGLARQSRSWDRVRARAGSAATTGATTGGTGAGVGNQARVQDGPEPGNGVRRGWGEVGYPSAGTWVGHGCAPFRHPERRQRSACWVDRRRCQDTVLWIAIIHMGRRGVKAPRPVAQRGRHARRSPPGAAQDAHSSTGETGGDTEEGNATASNGLPEPSGGGMRGGPHQAQPRMRTPRQERQRKQRGREGDYLERLPRTQRGRLARRSPPGAAQDAHSSTGETEEAARTRNATTSAASTNPAGEACEAIPIRRSPGCTLLDRERQEEIQRKGMRLPRTASPNPAGEACEAVPTRRI